MTATNTSKPAKDGTGGAFTVEMAAESLSGNIARKTYVASPSTEALIEPMQQTGGTVGIVAAGIAHNASTSSATSLVLKASAGNLYDCYVQSSIAGFLMVFDATSAPADGTVTPAHVVPVAAGQSGGVDSGILPEVYTTGISICISTTGGFTKTTPGSGVFFFHGRVK